MGSGGFPCGGVDIVLLATIKRSPQYRAIRERIINPYPGDGWYEEELAFIIFDLHPLDGQEKVVDSTPQVAFILKVSTRHILIVHVVE